MKNISLAGPGAYARTIPNEILVKIVNDSKQREEFLEFCYMYDSNRIKMKYLQEYIEDEMV